MTFEEQFPSLTVRDRYAAEDIQRCCVDKQRVKEAIQKIRDVLSEQWKVEGYMVDLTEFDDMEKELGL